MNLVEEIKKISGLYNQIGANLERCILIPDAMRIAEEYADEMCKRQREICANKAYPVIDHYLFRTMQDEIRNAKLATEDK